jgi:hypothetical protein
VFHNGKVKYLNYIVSLPFILLVSEQDCDQSQIRHVFRKYHIDNAIVEADRSSVMAGFLEEKRNGFPGLPEFMMVSIGPGAAKLLNLLHQMLDTEPFSEIPVIVLMDTAEESESLKALGFKKVFSMVRPVGYFKLLEALQKLEMHWLIFKS